jgi:hypothetical protein
VRTEPLDWSVLAKMFASPSQSTGDFLSFSFEQKPAPGLVSIGELLKRRKL